RDVPGLTGTAPFVVSVAEVMVGESGAFLKAVDLRAGPPAVGGWRREGAVSDLGRPARCPGEAAAGRILLGSALARQLKARVGSCVNVLVPFDRRDPSLIGAAVPFQVMGL